MPGQSIPGAIAGAFRSDKPDIRFTTVDENRQNRLNKLWGGYDTAFDPTKNRDYLAEYAGRTPQAKDISAQNINWLNKYITGPADPTQNYTTLLKANQDALGNFLMNPALAQLTRQRKEAQARGGYGGQGRGTYDSLLEGRLMQQLASQAVPNLLGSTTQAYGIAGGLGQQDFLNRLGIIGSGEQYRQLDVPALRYLEPQRLGRADLDSSLGALGRIATQEDLNRVYYRQPGLAERIGRGFNEVQSGIYNEVNDVLDLYTKAYGSGMLGGMGVTGGGAPGSADAGPWASSGSDLGKARLAAASQRSNYGGDYENLIRQLIAAYGGSKSPAAPTSSSPYYYPGGPPGGYNVMQYYSGTPTPWAYQ